MKKFEDGPKPLQSGISMIFKEFGVQHDNQKRVGKVKASPTVKKIVTIKKPQSKGKEQGS